MITLPAYIIGYRPRKLRIQYPGALYHVMHRGDGREDIYADDKDRQRFLAALGQAGVRRNSPFG